MEKGKPETWDPSLSPALRRCLDLECRRREIGSPSFTGVGKRDFKLDKNPE